MVRSGSLPRLAIAAALAAPACSSALDVETTQQEIVGGSASTDDAVVAVLGTVGPDELLCSGAVIAPRVVLTAAHCLADRDSIDVLFGTDIHDDLFGGLEATIPAASWQPHPDWDNSSSDLFAQHYDIGLIVLSSDAPATPLPYDQTGLTASDVGGTMRLIGYGNTTNGGLDSGKRLVATTTLRSYDDWWTTAGDQNGTTCVGDSGGPQLMTLGGTEVIVGVTSFGTAPPNEQLCQFDTIAARVDIAATDFIAPFIAELEAPPDADADAGASAGSDAGIGEDTGDGGCSTTNGGGSPSALLALAIAVLANRRRR